MNPDSGESPTRPSSKISLALECACVGVWVAAVASAGLVGVWIANGGAAIALGTAVLVLDREASRKVLVPSLQRILVGAAVGGVMAAATYLLYPLLTRIAPFIAADTARLYAAFRAPSLAIACLAIAPVILGEELVWRGVVQSALVRRLGSSGGVALAAGVYALALAPVGSPILVLVALACGLTWGTLRAVTGSLVPTLVAHLLWDGLVLLWLPLDSR